MAQRPRNQSGNGEGFDRSTAEDVVFSNLELGDELGGDTDDDNELDLDDDQGLDLDDDQSGDDDPLDPSQIDSDEDGEPLRDLRVSHTERRQKPEKKPLPRRSEVKPDGKGNLVNAKGEIVARGGAQARLYQKAERAKRDLSQTQAQVTDLTTRLNKLAGIARNLHTQVESYKGVEGKMKEFGLTPQKQLAAMQLFSDLENNPQQTIKRILTRAAANGINLAELGAGGSGGLDAKALADLVKGEVGKLIDPLKQRAERTDAQDQQREQARREQEAVQAEVDQFFDRNPKAVPYAPLFKKALADPRYQGWSLGEVWAKIVENLAARGDGRQRSRTPNTGRSIPRGRGAAPSGNSNVADPSMSYGDILKDVMRQHGAPERV